MMGTNTYMSWVCLQWWGPTHNFPGFVCNDGNQHICFLLLTSVTTITWVCLQWWEPTHKFVIKLLLLTSVTTITWVCLQWWEPTHKFSGFVCNDGNQLIIIQRQSIQDMFSVLQFLIVFGFLVETFGLTFGALGGSLGPPWAPLGFGLTFGALGGSLGPPWDTLWPHF